MKITFVETKPFLKKVRKTWNVADYADLKDDLTDNPDLGDIIKGGDGIRKLRRRIAGSGKSGGVRIIYFWAVSRDIIVMLDIYKKGDKETLTDRELITLVQLKREILGE